MKIKSQRDFWAGLMFLGIGIAFAVGASNYSLGNSARPGPGYFPLILSVIMVILGAVVLFTSLTIESDGGDPVGHIAWKPLGIIVGAILVFAILITRLGMIMTVPIVIAVASLASDEFHWKDVLINAAVLTLGCWLIFIRGLSLTIPMWPAFLAG